MKIKIYLKRLEQELGYKPTYEKLTEILKVIKPLSKNALAGRVHSNGNIKEEEIELINKHYQIELNSNNNIKKTKEYIEIPYYTNPNLATDLKLPDITTIWMDKELIVNKWKRDKNNLRVVTMLGDKMDGGTRPIHIDDVLLMDISDHDVTKAGIYAFTTYNDKYMYINSVYRKFDGSYSFTFANPKYPEKVLTQADIQKACMRVVGRVFINLTDTF